MNGKISQPIAPRAIYNNILPGVSIRDMLDPLLPSERIDEDKYNNGVIGTGQQGPAQEFSKESLKNTLRKQLDFYFSTQNLASDEYLVSQMDKEQFVPIWTVANFNLIKKLTNDIELITEALTECVNVQLNESKTKVRPNYQRCVIILRDVPAVTHLEDVKELFTGEGCPSFVSCEFAGNDAWYITFPTDDDAQKAYTYLRETVKEFLGKPIHASIKAKTMRTAASNVQAYKSHWNAHQTNTMFDTSYPANQQRYIVHNGATLPYPNQQLFFQQFPPTGQVFVPTAAHWQTNFYDINSVFQVNGLAPQTTYRPPHRNNGKQKKKTATQLDQGTIATSSMAARQTTSQMSIVNRNNPNSRITEIPEAPITVALPYPQHPVPLLDMSNYGYAPPPMAMPKEPVPPRHRRRRRDDENAAGPSQTQEVQQRAFDLGHTAFPPLRINSKRLNNTEESSSSDQPAQTSDAVPWSDHRIVDILRGNTTSKSSSTSTSSKGSSANDNESPRAGSPQMNEARDVTEGIEVALSSTLTITPPVSPEKSQDSRCTMTDKSTKIDDVLLNGDPEVCPTTTNAATMTTAAESSIVRTDPSNASSVLSGLPHRMSYAQVAQHLKERGNQKEKREKVSAEGESSSASAVPVQNGDKKSSKDNPLKQEKAQRNRHGPSKPTGSSNNQSKNDKKRHNGKKNTRSK